MQRTKFQLRRGLRQKGKVSKEGVISGEDRGAGRESKYGDESGIAVPLDLGGG